jgi:dTDP-glucose 4,6-dehydratase
MGSNFIRFLLKEWSDVSVVNLDALTYAGNQENVVGIDEKRYRFFQGDIADGALVRKLMAEVDTVVNFAAETHVDRSIHGTVGDFVHTNIEGVHALLEALRESQNVTKMIHISTDEVWGDLSLESKEQFDEESPLRPNSPYAASKAGGDLLVRAYVKTYDTPVIVSHSVNNFGPRQFPEKIIPFFTLQAMQDKLLPLYGDGKYVRDWVYVDDHSSAILALIEKGVVGEDYAISTSEEMPNIELAKKILRIAGKPEDQITFVKDRPAHDRRYSVNSAKIRALGWEPVASFDEKLKETVQWYAENKSWVAGVMEKHANINAHIV